MKRNNNPFNSKLRIFLWLCNVFFLFFFFNNAIKKIINHNEESFFESNSLPTIPPSRNTRNKKQNIQKKQNIHRKNFFFIYSFGRDFTVSSNISSTLLKVTPKATASPLSQPVPTPGKGNKIFTEEISRKNVFENKTIFLFYFLFIPEEEISQYLPTFPQHS